MTCPPVPSPFGAVEETDETVTHACPVGSDRVTPCCRRDPFSLPLFDRLTLHEEMVTCGRDATAEGEEPVAHG